MGLADLTFDTSQLIGESTVHTNRLHHLTTVSGPFASVHYDDSHDTENSGKRLQLEWRDARAHLKNAGAPESMLEVLDGAVSSGAPPVGRSGRALIANDDEVVLDEHLMRPPAKTEVRFSSVPYLVPVVEHGIGEHPYLLVAVDRDGADISMHRFGTAAPSFETASGGEYPIHKASGAETSGYGDPQPRVEEAVRRNIATVAHDVDVLLDKHHPDIVFVVGEVRAREGLVHALADRTRVHTVELDVGSRAAGANTEAVDEAISEEFAKRRLQALDDVAERLRAELGRGSGLAAEGLDGVSRELRAGNVATLVFGDMGERTVLVGDDPTWVATSTTELSEFGSSETSTRRADEALPFAALAGSGDVVRIDERIELVDGCAALLRHK